MHDVDMMMVVTPVSQLPGVRVRSNIPEKNKNSRKKVVEMHDKHRRHTDAGVWGRQDIPRLRLKKRAEKRLPEGLYCHYAAVRLIIRKVRTVELVD